MSLVVETDELAFLARRVRLWHGARVRECTKELIAMIRKLSLGSYRLYSRHRDPKTGRRRNLGTFKSRAAAERHERAVQFFKRR